MPCRRQHAAERNLRVAGAEPLHLAGDVAVAGSRRADLAASGEGQRRAGTPGAVRAVTGEGRGADGRAVPVGRHPGGGPRRLLDTPLPGARGYRELRRRRRLDCRFTTQPARQDGQARRRGAGPHAAGLQARGAAGVCDGGGAERRGRGPATHLARAAGFGRGAGAARQPHQGPAVRARGRSHCAPTGGRGWTNW